MKLLTQDIIAKLPKLGSMRDNANAEIICKFSAPIAHTSWYIIEGESVTNFNGTDWMLYGMVINNHIISYPDGTSEELSEQNKSMGGFFLSDIEANVGSKRDAKFPKTFLKDLR